MATLKQSGFSRVLYADAKYNAYYTDTGHTARMGYLLGKLPKEVVAIDPTCGDGSAFLALLGNTEKGDDTTVTTYGVEIMPDVASAVSEKLDHVLNADFINGAEISKSCFNLCWSNPPYGEGEGSKDRLEIAVVKGIYQLMVTGGVLFLTVGYPELQKTDFLTAILNRFSIREIFKADDAEFKKWQQIFLVCIRKPRQGWEVEERSGIQKRLEDLENIPYLPKSREEAERTYAVPESSDEKVEIFASKIFDAKKAVSGLGQSPLFTRLDEMLKQKVYEGIKIGRPPVPLKKDLLYLTAIAGGGMGAAGSREDGTYHLQRGSASSVETVEPLYDDKGNQIGEEARTHTEITMCIIEPNGTCTELGNGGKQ